MEVPGVRGHDCCDIYRWQGEAAGALGNFGHQSGCPYRRSLCPDGEFCQVFGHLSGQEVTSMAFSCLDCPQGHLPNSWVCRFLPLGGGGDRCPQSQSPWTTELGPAPPHGNSQTAEAKKVYQPVQSPGPPVLHLQTQFLLRSLVTFLVALRSAPHAETCLTFLLGHVYSRHMHHV